MSAKREALIRRRLALGYSQEDLAAQVNVDTTTVGRWERGTSGPQPWKRPSLARALQVTLEQLDDMLAPSRPGRAEAGPVASATGEFFEHSAQHAIAFAEKLTASAQPVDIEALHLRVAGVASAYLIDPLDAVVPELQTLRALCETVLSAVPRRSTDLLVILARTLALLANAAMDAGVHKAAHEHAEAAVRLADAAGHRGVAAWARGLQASNAFWADDPKSSASLAAAALDGPGQGTTSVFLACLLARAAGRVADHRGVERALVLAQEAREHADLDEIGGVFGFPQAKQHLYAASAYLGIDGAPAHALRHAQQAVMLYGRSPARNFGDESGARLDVATSYLRLGELDGAIDAIEPVLTLPVGMRVATVRTRLIRVRRELRSGYADQSAARETIERIGAVLAPTG